MSSPANLASFSRATFFPELLSKFSAARDQIHERRPADSNSVTHLVFSVRTPYHLNSSHAPGSVFDHLTAPDLEMIRSGKWKLLLDLGWEAIFPRPDIIEPFHQALRDLRIPPKNVFLLNSNLGSEEAYRSATPDPESRVNVLPFSVGAFLFLSHHQGSGPSGFDEFVERESAARAGAADRRAFVNFNGRMRPHRCYLVSFLLATGLIDRGFVSLLAYERSTSGSKLVSPKEVEALRDRLLERTGEWPYADLALPTFERVLERMPLELDLSAEEAVRRGRYKKITPWELQNMDLYRRSYFSVVADTSCLGSALFLTEKVFKPLISLHPVVYLGHRGALVELRRLGFQTFGPLIDESYDQEPQAARRVGMVLDEIRRLCSLPENGLKAIYDGLWPRLVHNARLGRLHGLELGRREFEEKVLARLETAEPSRPRG